MHLEVGQVAVVTGGASGIGLALADAFAQRGLRVVIADVRPEPLADSAALLERHGAGLLAVPTDVADAAAVDALAAATLEHFGRVDVICNNAGVVGPFAPAWEQATATWEWVMNVAFMGVVHGIRSFVPHLVAQGSGYVLNTASVGGLMTLPGLAPYNAAKHAVVALSETLREELWRAGAAVGVSVLCPGMVHTSLRESSAAVRPAGVPVNEPVAPTDVSTDARASGGDDYGATVTPADVARLALGGIEADRLHILTHDDSARPVRKRVQRVLDDLESG